MRTLGCLVTFLVVIATSRGVPPDEDAVLKKLLGKSELVLRVTVDEVRGPSSHEGGMVNYYPVDVSVLEVLKGVEPQKKLKVSIVLYGDKDDDMPPALRRGAKCILFLRRPPMENTPVWRSADPRFSVQHGSPSMVEQIKRLVEDEKSKPAGRGATPDGDAVLKRLLSKSELVLRVTVDEVHGPNSHEGGLVNDYPVDVTVLEVLKGVEPQKKLKAMMVLYGDQADDRPPTLRRGAKCILFLKRLPKGSIPTWENADRWFGIQHGSPSMAEDIKEIAKDAAEEEKSKPAGDAGKPKPPKP